jgi:hypothetical protein
MFNWRVGLILVAALVAVVIRPTVRAPTSSTLVSGDGSMRLVDATECRRNERPVGWNIQGVKGDPLLRASSCQRPSASVIRDR